MGPSASQPLQKRNALATVLTGRHRHHAPRSHVAQGTTDMRIAATLSLLALAVLTPALNANAATPTPITQQNVSLALADGLIQQTLDACHAQNRTAVVAVVDRGGNLVALRRDDNVGPHNPGRAAQGLHRAVEQDADPPVRRTRRQHAGCRQPQHPGRTAAARRWRAAEGRRRGDRCHRRGRCWRCQERRGLRRGRHRETAALLPLKKRKTP